MRSYEILEIVEMWNVDCGNSIRHCNKNLNKLTDKSEENTEQVNTMRKQANGRIVMEARPKLKQNNMAKHMALVSFGNTTFLYL